MNHEALLMLISNLAQQISDQQAQIIQLQSQLAETHANSTPAVDGPVDVASPEPVGV